MLFPMGFMAQILWNTATLGPALKAQREVQVIVL